MKVLSRTVCSGRVVYCSTAMSVLVTSYAYAGALPNARPGRTAVNRPTLVAENERTFAVTVKVGHAPVGSGQTNQGRVTLINLLTRHDADKRVFSNNLGAAPGGRRFEWEGDAET